MIREEALALAKDILDKSTLSSEEKEAVFNVLKEDLPDGDNCHCFPGETDDMIFEIGGACARYHINYSDGTLDIYESSTDYVHIRIGINHLI